MVDIDQTTGRSDMVDTVVGLAVGVDDYIAKPLQLRAWTACCAGCHSCRRVRPQRR
jgi:DNA-binding response OmpR family regulator